MKIATLLVVLVIGATGRRDSDLIPLLYLPLILAVVSCSFVEIIGIGLFLTVALLFFYHPIGEPFALKPQGIVRTTLLNAMALIGAFYARRVERERAALRNTVKEKNILLSASQIINSADRLEQALNSTLLLLRTLIPHFQSAVIFLADETQRTMKLASLLGADMSEIQTDSFSLRTRQIGWLPGDPSPYYVPDTNARPDSPLARIDRRARSAVCIGLRSLQVPIGMIYLSSDQPNAFSQTQIDLLAEFASRIGFPLQRLRVQEGLRGLAFTDGMTGLYNFRSFRLHLTEEMRRAVRYRRPLSLVILDLDFFKAINDRYGHPAGDKLLVGVADIIRNTVREIDLPARYGGEEFVVICPETNAAEGVVVAERIRATVEAARFQMAEGESCAVTVSVGVATYPQDAGDEAGLLQAADDALYYAKHHGKNRVVAAHALTQASSETS